MMRATLYMQICRLNIAFIEERCGCEFFKITKYVRFDVSTIRLFHLDHDLLYCNVIYKYVKYVLQ